MIEAGDNFPSKKEDNKEHPLKMFSLKGNQICGSILIGNYNVSLDLCSSLINLAKKDLDD